MNEFDDDTGERLTWEARQKMSVRDASGYAPRLDAPESAPALEAENADLRARLADAERRREDCGIGERTALEMAEELRARLERIEKAYGDMIGQARRELNARTTSEMACERIRADRDEWRGRAERAEAALRKAEERCTLYISESGTGESRRMRVACFICSRETTHRLDERPIIIHMDACPFRALAGREPTGKADDEA